MEDHGTIEKNKKKSVSKNAAIAVMIAGAALFVLAIAVPGEQGTPVYMGKIAAGVIGFIVFLVGAYLRPANTGMKKENS